MVAAKTAWPTLARCIALSSRPHWAIDGWQGAARQNAQGDQNHSVWLFLLQCATSATASDMKPRTITQRELRNQSAIGELRPIGRRRFVPRASIADAADKAARIDAAQFRADIDAVIDPYTLE